MFSFPSPRGLPFFNLSQICSLEVLWKVISGSGGIILLTVLISAHSVQKAVLGIIVSDGTVNDILLHPFMVFWIFRYNFSPVPLRLFVLD